MTEFGLVIQVREKHVSEDQPRVHQPKTGRENFFAATASLFQFALPLIRAHALFALQLRPCML